MTNVLDRTRRPTLHLPGWKPQRPKKPNRLEVAAELVLAHRKAVEGELEAAITAAKAVVSEPADTCRLRVALAIVEAAPSWPVWKLDEGLREKGLAELSRDLRFVVLGLRAGRFAASIKSAIEIRVRDHGADTAGDVGAAAHP